VTEAPDEEASCTYPEGSAVELVVTARPRDLGGFFVGRVLPSAARRLVGPFIFFDHMTRHELAPGHGMDVRPHPHIGLATLTYLFEGEIVHRDSLGSVQPIRPGDVNWMAAGRGIAHSERTGDERRRSGGAVHGIQCWVAFPRADEEIEPRFEHHPHGAIPLVDRPGARLRVIAGSAYGARSPVGVRSPTFFVHAELDAGADLLMPDEHEERAAYVVDGHAPALFRARKPSRLMLLGGAPLDGPRHIWWNFVSSSKDRIERAKQQWTDRAFPPIPGDDVEFIPLPL
jgi:redox-sensitive bicupin YhaK (pirin superfamily)